MKTKSVIFILLILASSIINAQKRNFKKIEKFRNKVSVETIDSSEPLNLDFYRKHFFIPYYYPQEFLSKKFRNEKIVTWAHENLEKNKTRNWTFTFTYDEFGKVTKYEYSSCFFCSQLPYEILISYDKFNRPISLLQRYSKSDSSPSIVNIEYDINNQIVSLKKYSGKTLEMEISVVE